MRYGWTELGEISFTFSATILFTAMLLNIYRLYKGYYDRSNNFQMFCLISLTIPILMIIILADFIVVIVCIFVPDT